MQKKFFKILQFIPYVILSIILFNQIFKIVPNTEGWFVELTNDKNLFQVIGNDEILIPPLYPLFIWILNKISNQLIFLRVVGFVVGFILYDQTDKLISRGTFILINDERKNTLINFSSKISSIFLIIFICNISTYLLWYDFTVLVLTLQLFIINSTLIVIDSLSYEKEKYINFSLLIGFLLILGVLLKHSNMGVFLISFQFSMFLVWGLFKSERKWLNKVFFSEAISIGICITLILLNLILGQNDFLNQFLSASVAAKGGEEIVFKFVMNGINHLIYELKRIDTVFLGTFLFLYFRKVLILKYIGIFIFNLFFAFCIFNSNYNLAGYSIKIIVILFVSLLFTFLENIIYSVFSIKNSTDQINKFNKLVFILFGSIGCIIGNFTSAGLGYNGYFIGLVIGIILQLSFFIELIKFTEQENFIALK